MKGLLSGILVCNKIMMGILWCEESYHQTYIIIMVIKTKLLNNFQNWKYFPQNLLWNKKLLFYSSIAKMVVVTNWGFPLSHSRSINSIQAPRNPRVMHNRPITTLQMLQLCFALLQINYEWGDIVFYDKTIYLLLLYNIKYTVNG